jgi:hypothetical protein
MKRLYSVLILVFFSVLAFHCQKEVSNGIDTPDPNNNNPNVAVPISATLQGNVFDENKLPAAGVTVKVGSKTTVTDVRGYFRIYDAALDKNASLVVAEKTGYLKAFRTFRATSGVNQVVIELIKKTLAGTVNASAGGTVSLSNGSKVALPANGFVKASGSGAYTGTVNVYSSYIDPTADNIDEVIPGSFMANDKNNNRVTLASYGMMAVELESAAGEKLQIAPGSKAILTTAIPTTLQAAAPATISLWYVDEATGIWKEEGTATKNGNTYVGDVKHFTYWNCDVSVPVVPFSATFHTSAGSPLVHTLVRVRAANNSYGGVSYGYTDSLGQVHGWAPANINLVMEVIAYGQCNSVIYSQNIGPFSAAVNLGTITITINSPTAYTIKGKLVNCSNTAVANGYALVVFDNNWVRYVDVNSNGEFSTLFINCNTSVGPVQITGVDRAAQQQGMVASLPATAPVTDAGTLSACGTSTAEFINYDIDGVAQSIGLSDSLMVYTWPLQVPGTYTHHTSIFGGIWNVKSVNCEFDNNNTAGSYPITRLSLNDYERIATVAPFNVTVTKFPANIGEHMEGSFSGQFRDSSNLAPLHTVNATFRVRRNW